MKNSPFKLLKMLGLCLQRSSKFSLKDQSRLFYNLALLLKAGLPLSKALKVLSLHPGFLFLKQIDEELHHGKTFSQSLTAYPDKTSPFILGIIKVGEDSGRLEEAVGRISHYLEEAEALRGRLFQLLSYPAFILTLCFCSLVFTLTFILPSFVSIFSDLNIKLPTLTLWAINFGAFLQHNFFYLLFFLLFTIFSVKVFLLRKERYQLIAEAFLLRLPFYGDLKKRLSLGRLLSALAFLMEAGIPLYQAVNLCADISTSRVFKNVFFRISHGLMTGKSLSICFKHEKLFDPEIIEMVMVGEESGNLASLLFKAGELYEKGAEKRLKTLVSIMEPLSTVTVGIVVGIIAFSIFLPLLDMISSL